jgi:hypothetical protein
MREEGTMSALHSDPNFYTDDLLTGLSDEELDGLISDVTAHRDSADLSSDERDRWNDLLIRLSDLREQRRRHRRS